MRIGQKAKHYLERYKKFSEDFTSFLKILTNEDPGEHLDVINCLAPTIQEVLSEYACLLICIYQINYLTINNFRIYEDLYKLELELPVPEEALQLEPKEIGSKLLSNL